VFYLILGVCLVSNVGAKLRILFTFASSF